MVGQAAELERLRLQAKVWEPAGEQLLARLGDGSGLSALDVGCGAYGWLPILSRWVGELGRVTGTDIDDKLLAAARELRLENVEVVNDDLFNSALPEGGYDLVHARFELAPIGRYNEQLRAHKRLLKPGGWLVLEETDTGSWHFNPPAPASEQLVELVSKAFLAGGGNLDAGRELPSLLRYLGIEPEIDAHVIALPAAHPYSRNHIAFSNSLEQRLEQMLPLDELRTLRAEAEREVADPQRWITTFTLVQAWGRIP